jgi:hypothetical protein
LAFGLKLDLELKPTSELMLELKLEIMLVKKKDG